MEIKKCVTANQLNGALAASVCRRVVDALQKRPDMVEVEFSLWNKPGHYEKLLMPLVTPESILRGIAAGVLPSLQKGGWNLGEFAGVLAEMGTAAVRGPSTAERWLWASINKSRKSKRRAKSRVEGKL